MDVQEVKNEIYRQLAKSGRFEELPSTCEFSEPVELEVWDNDYKQKEDAISYKILGKFKGKYINNYEEFWDFAQLPTPKIDFSEFNIGDVVEVETESYGVFFGMIHTLNERGLVLTFGEQSGTLRMITDVKSIKKIK